ncbi:MAG TPA: di-heme oxidoredictase family protein [Thermoanaerobaculia bacterium]|nr:di-heme oxidoredictase family protein [Thermoanaerobaculia bacterium]
MAKQQSTRKRLVARGLALSVLVAAPVVYAVTTEAPAGFDNLTNGFEAQANMDADRAKFDEIEQISDGLGPNYNAQSCRECHQNPVSGTISQVTELRAGTFDGNTFTPHPGGSLIFSRAIDPSIQVRALGTDNVATFRTSLNIAGDGFVEALPDSAFTAVQSSQPSSMRGTIIRVPVLEASGVTRIGRFGWKNQHASLLSFASDAYLNEMGITNPLNPTENTSNGTSVTYLNTQNGVPAMQDPATQSDPFGADIGSFTRFMRSMKVPPRDTVLAATSDARAGATLFSQIGCNICHVPTLTTAPTGTSFNGGQFIVPAALGSMNIHPYGDFMLHDVGTGDFIVQNGGIGTLTLMRTAPLWGMRTRNRLMHDGENILRNDAILRHTNQAEAVIENYIYLSTNQKNQIITFLNSL